MNVQQVRTGVYKADFRDINNRRCRPTFEAPNKKEAERIAKRMQKKGMDALPQRVGSNGMTLKEALDKADVEHYSLSKNRKRAASTGLKLQESLGSDLPIKLIDYDLLQELVNTWRAEGTAGATINRRLSHLYKVLRLSLMWKHGGVPALTVMPQLPKKLKESKGRTRIITKEEEQNSLGFLTGVQRDLFVVLMDTGMRLGEALGIQYAPLNQPLVDDRIEKGFYSYGEINMFSKRIHVWANKGDRPRTVPMSDRVFETLKERQRIPEDTMGEVIDNRPFRITHDQVSSQWRRLRKELKLAEDSGFTPHACRHSCATRLWELTGDIYLVKEWLGHASVTTTERYTHLSSAKLEGAVELINGLSK